MTERDSRADNVDDGVVIEGKFFLWLDKFGIQSLGKRLKWKKKMIRLLNFIF